MEGGDSVLQFLGWSVPRRVDSFYTGLSPGVHGVGLGGRRLGWGGSGEGSCAPAASFDGQDKKKTTAPRANTPAICCGEHHAVPPPHSDHGGVLVGRLGCMGTRVWCRRRCDARAPLRNIIHWRLHRRGGHQKWGPQICYPCVCHVDC